MDGNGVVWYEPLDEDGVDMLLPPSELKRPFVYRPSRLNEKIIEVQERIDKNLEVLEGDLARMLGLAMRTHERLQESEKWAYGESFGMVGVMGALGYFRNRHRSLPGRVTITLALATGTSLFIFPRARKLIKDEANRVLPIGIKDKLVDLERLVDRKVVFPLVNAWEWFDEVITRLINR